MRIKLGLRRVDPISIVVSFLIVVNLRILDFGDWQTAYRILTAAVSLVLGAYCILSRRIYRRISKYARAYNKWIIAVFVLLAIETFNGWINGAYHLITYIGYDYIFLWLLLFYPIMYIGVKQNGFHRLFKFICIMTVIALIMKTIVWWLYNFRGIDIMHYVLYEFTEAWLRKGRQRIPATCFSGLLFGITLITLLKSKRIAGKILALAVILFSVWYAWDVFSSRAQIISFLVATCAALAFGENTTLRRMIVYVIIAIGAIVALETVFVQEFIDGLSTQTYSIGTRFEAIEYYFQLLRQNPLLGGLYIHTESIMRGPTGAFYISDMGYLGTLIEFGIVGFIVFLWPFFVLLKKAFLSFRKHPDRIFAIYLAIYTIVFSALSNNIYNFRQFFALPFIMAYYYYESYTGKSKTTII